MQTDQLRKKLQEEAAVLEHERVHELPKEIKRAAALGDLSENAEYHGRIRSCVLLRPPR